MGGYLDIILLVNQIEGGMFNLDTHRQEQASQHAVRCCLGIVRLSNERRFPPKKIMFRGDFLLGEGAFRGELHGR